jgi:hypothetical protein
MTPNAYKSTAAVIGSPASCSGAAYPGVAMQWPRSCQLGCAHLSVANQQFGNAEVEQLDLLVARHEDVGWLQIAMCDQPAMGVAHRIEDLQKQVQAP